jgi:YD repeat-containing protein
MRTTFEYPGSGSTFRLKSFEDPDKNIISCEYDTNGRLWRITDTLGRYIIITYNSTTPTLIEKVTDFAGREVVYSYDSNNNLASVRTPTITSTNEGGTPFNDFMSGRTESYTYSSSTTTILDHNLLTVERPNEHGLSRPAITFTYYTSSSGSGFEDWCASQTLGNSAGSFPLVERSPTPTRLRLFLAEWS